MENGFVTRNFSNVQDIRFWAKSCSKTIFLDASYDQIVI